MFVALCTDEKYAQLHLTIVKEYAKHTHTYTPFIVRNFDNFPFIPFNYPAYY